MAATAFRSEERFTQLEFVHWLSERPATDTSHYELLHGQIVMEPPAGWRHGGVGAALVEQLRAHVRTRRLGKILDASAGIDLPSGDIVEPDVTYVAHAQLAAAPAQEPDCLLHVVPRLVIEIVSPSTARRDRTEKKAIYEHNRVAEYWIVDADRREVTIFRLDAGVYDAGTIFVSGRLHSRVLPDLEIDLADIFDF